MNECKYCHGHGWVLGPSGTHDCDCVRENMKKKLEEVKQKIPTKRVKWPEYDEYCTYENETSYLRYLCDMWGPDSTWSNVAWRINEEFHNNRTPSSCRRKADKLGF